MTVYADILFATNLVVNYLLLALSTQLVRQNPKRLRLLISAVVGAIGSFEMLFQLPIYISIPFKLLGIYPAEAASITDCIRIAFLGASIPALLLRVVYLKVNSPSVLSVPISKSR